MGVDGCGVWSQGLAVANAVHVKLMRKVKREVLTLVQTCVESATSVCITSLAPTLCDCCLVIRTSSQCF